MSQADRLYRLLAYLRQRHRPVTAKAIADHLEVSVRTVYRDIANLVANDVPIRGEAGVGYVLDRGAALPAVQLDVEEIQALVLGARIVERFADPSLRAASRSALDKLATAVPGGLSRIEGTPLFAVPPFAVERAESLGPLRQAIGERRPVRFTYATEAGDVTHRTVRPLGLWFWGRTWTLGAWCELRNGYRMFRVDRITFPHLEDRTFTDEPPNTVEGLLAHVAR